MRYNGPHFNRKLCEFATSLMTKEGPSGEEVPVKPYTKEELESLLKAHNVKLKNN
jgi:putative aminopeptidase FrvX